jgi:CBS domain-containing protein
MFTKNHIGEMGMRALDVMTKPVITVKPEKAMREAARVLKGTSQRT